MQTQPVPASLVPACINCGYSQEGLAGAASCPECGSRRTQIDASGEWSASMRWGLKVLAWTIPAGLLAWAAEAIVQISTDQGTYGLIRDGWWIGLVIMTIGTLGLQHVLRGLGSSRLHARTMWLCLVVLGLMVIDGARLSGAIDDVVGVFISGHVEGRVQSALECISACAVSAWLWYVCRSIGGASAFFGVARAGATLRTWSAPLVVLMAVTTLISQSWIWFGDNRTRVFPTLPPNRGIDLLGRICADYFQQRISVAATAVLFVLLWRTVLLMQRQLVVLGARQSGIVVPRA